ncbi:hypothetical protein SDC9_143847 [bioreactor metagenome]|uniref:Uncharacterized protein n=1 Tax=bioreactor metagenome TaxID=1076179 RepID=A0A645E7T9_9ZZZZ
MPELVAHVLHAEKKESQPDNRLSPARDRRPGREAHRQSDDDRRHDDPADFKRHQLSRYRSADVRAENDADGLNQVQQPGVDEADDHDRAGT